MGIQRTASMAKYREHLMHKYKSLRLSLPEALLEGSSSEYAKLLIKQFDEQTQTSKESLISAPLNRVLCNSSMSFHANKRTNIESEPLTLSDVLDITGKEKKVILIEGRPGMGKSTLAIKICKCWADGELLQEYDAVILLTLRDPEIQVAQSIKDLLLISDEELRDEVYKEIVEGSGNRVCFILEGYDELPQQLRVAPVFSSWTENLPKCMLVYTSRPEACDRLRHLAVNKIEICGFKEDEVGEYIKNAFLKVESGEEKATKLLTQVKSNPSIKSILYAPLNVAIICHLFLLTLQLPNTLTQLYTLLCLNLILHHTKKLNNGNAKVEHLDSFDDLPIETSEQFLNLCLIAYRGRVDDKVIFSSHEIEGYSIDANKMSGLGLLLTAPTTSVHGREKSYNFLHVMLQEFCAAFYISKLPTLEQIECFNKFKFNESFKMIWIFYSGITGLRNKDMLYHMLPSKLALAYSQYRGRRTIELLHCIYETQNSDVCQLVGSHLDGEIFLLGCELDMISCTTVVYLLEQYRGELKLVNCRKCVIGNEMFTILINALLSRCGKYSSHLQLDFWDTEIPCSLVASLLSSNVPIHKLDMGINDDHIYIDTTLFDALHQNTTLTELSLNGIGLKPKHIESLGEALSNNNTLSVLDISCNCIGCNGCQHLANVRGSSLRELIISDCDIEDDGADYVGKLLSHSKSIRSVDLDDNCIKDEGVEKLVERLRLNKTLKRLDLSSNGITSVGANHLANLFASNSCAINNINLDGNALDDEAVELILKSIPITMECIGLGNMLVTSCNSSLCKALHKIKSIRFTPPDNCNDISNSLADTTVLEQLYMCNGSDTANNTMIRGICRNSSIKILFILGGCLNQHTILGFAEFIKVSNTIVAFGIICEEISVSDYLLLADALAVNTSIKKIIISQIRFDKSQALQFLKELKHNYTLALLVLHDIDEAEDDDQFNRDVEMLVEEINYIRQHNGVTTPLQVCTWVCCNNYYMKQVKYTIIIYNK